MTDEKFNCAKCLNQKRPEHIIEKMRELKGCWQKSEKPRYEIEEIKYYKCIGNYYTPEFTSIWSAFLLYKKGHMPFGGCLNDQPAKLVETMNILYNLETEYKEQERQKQKQELARKRR